MKYLSPTHFFFFFLALALLLVGCAANGSPSAPLPTAPAGRSFTDAMSRTVSLPEIPQRIVSLAPSNTEILFAIGAGEQVVGRDAFSDYPEAAKAVADVGGGISEMNNELLVSLNPDLVLASALNTPEQIQALQDLGLKVYVLANPLDLQGMFANLALVGQITGHEGEAEKLVKDLQKRVDAVTGKLADAASKPLVYYELDSTNPNAPWTAGPGSFVDALISMAGGRNVASGLSSAWAQISVEELIKQNPQVILLGNAYWGGVTAADVLARPGWGTIDAVQNQQIFPFDDNLVSRPGPRLVDGLEALARQFHPGLFE